MNAVVESLQPSKSESKTPTQETSNELINKVIEPKLYAGKYKTVEELENAYKNSTKVFNENKELQEKFKVPENYNAPDDLSLRATELAEIKAIARNAGLTQEQFEKTAREMAGRVQKNLEVLEQTKQEIGEEKLTLIKDHIKKSYPESIQEAIYNQAIRDKTAMSDILNERDKKLNSTTPGIDKASSSGTPSKYDGQKDVQEAALAFKKHPTEANRKRYIDIATQVGEERFKR